MRNRFTAWLDRYIHVDKLRIAPEQIVPRLRWWEWIWYLLAVTCGALALERLNTAMNAALAHVPVLHRARWLVTWPVLIAAYALGTAFLLPARGARARAPGETWLIFGLAMMTLLAEGVLSGR